MRAFVVLSSVFSLLFYLLLYPFCNYFEAKYQKFFFLDGTKIYNLSKEIFAKQEFIYNESKNKNFNKDIEDVLKKYDDELKFLKIKEKNQKILKENIAKGLEKKYRQDKIKKEKNLKSLAKYINSKKVVFDENLSVILIGDSIMHGIGWGFSNKKVKVENVAKSSTGLVNKKFFNWQDKFSEVLQNAPKNSIIIAHFGTNDGYSINHNGKRLKFGSSQWNEFYKSRVNEIYNISKKYDKNIFWLEIPCMKKSNFDKNMKIINKILKASAKENHAKFIEINEAICKNDEYLQSKIIGNKKRILRSDDGIHLSTFGAKVVVEFIIEEIEKNPFN
ncbi:DUF459 domain-containing protein [Campylobacter ureolyticus]|uniref:DUF459 domain-containing protein n=1 Tax=Campylobacter ureolyticus TaxID=827 RepID=UPI00215B34AE|nr:DUF459 domain-containing protein [Campylobacter ureolyticus]MCR8700218.1 DUF459 domain-containing protein [Campylobacter ureolyticus]